MSQQRSNGFFIRRTFSPCILSESMHILSNSSRKCTNSLCEIKTSTNTHDTIVRDLVLYIKDMYGIFLQTCLAIEVNIAYRLHNRPNMRDYSGRILLFRTTIYVHCSPLYKSYTISISIETEKHSIFLI
jgi:hypothetical protein